MSVVWVVAFDPGYSLEVVEVAVGESEGQAEILMVKPVNVWELY